MNARQLNFGIRAATERSKALREALRRVAGGDSAALARLEARVAFQALLARLEHIGLIPVRNDFKHTPNFILRGLRELWLEFDRA